MTTIVWRGRVRAIPANSTSWLRWLLAGLLLIAAMMSPPAAAAEWLRPLQWLQSQATTGQPFVSRTAPAELSLCEVGLTLSRWSTSERLVMQTADALAASRSVPATQALGCAAELLRRIAPGGVPTVLVQRQLASGAYSAYPDLFTESLPDTAWALSSTLVPDDADSERLLDWLQRQQATDGSFGAAGEPDLLATAWVARGLQGHAPRHARAAAMAARASAWLLSQWRLETQWMADVGTTAIVFEAVHPFTAARPEVAEGVRSFLSALLQSDGSWDGDSYLTAVALRALALSDVRPVDPSFGPTATLTGQVTHGDTQAPLPNALVTVADHASTQPHRTRSDEQGRWRLEGITAGSVEVGVTLDGFTPLTAKVTLGQAEVVSMPAALWPEGGGPPGNGTRVRGRVQAAGAAEPLAGVRVAVRGSAAGALSDAQGAFDLESPGPGRHGVSFERPEFEPLTLDVVLGDAGGDLGTVTLRRARTSGSVRGQVVDAQGQPVAQAMVVAGGHSTSTDARGHYLLQNLSGLSHEVRVTAASGASRSIVLTWTAPTDAVWNVTLPAPGTGQLALTRIDMPEAPLGLRREVEARVTVANTSAHRAQATPAGLVRNARGEVLARPAALDAQGGGLTAIELAPGEQASFLLRWNTGAWPPGTYRVEARLQVPGSAERDTLDGIVIGSLEGTLDIASSPSVSGAVDANPPALRAGLGTSTRLSALLRNDGNVLLAPQPYELALIDRATGQVAHRAVAVADALPVGSLVALDFGSWQPPAGEYLLRLTSGALPALALESRLYVGDAPAGSFTLDRSSLPTGTQRVKAAVRVTGTDVQSGTRADPLLPLVRAAITQAVKAGDAMAYEHYVTANTSQGRCFMCHVQTQAIVGGERSLRYTPAVSALRRAVLMSSVTQNLINEGQGRFAPREPLRPSASVAYRDAPDHYNHTTTTLGLWAASQWHEPRAVNLSRVRMANYLANRQSADGSWAPDHPDAWWRDRSPLVALNAGSFTSLREALRQGPAPTGKKLVPFPTSGLPGGMKRLSTGADGTVYAVNMDRDLWAIPPSGAPVQLVGNMGLRSAWPLEGGRLLLAGSGGVYLREPQGELRTLWTGNAMEARPHPNGNYIVTLWGGNALYQLTPDGVFTLLASDSRMSGTMGPALAQDGSLLAFGQFRDTVLRFSPQGQPMESPIPVAPVAALMNGMAYRDGFLLATEAGLFHYDKEWVAERWTHEYTFGQTVLPDGRLLISTDTGLYVLEDDPVDVVAMLRRIDEAMNRAGNWLVSGTGTDLSNNVDVAFRLMGLGHARAYFRGSPRERDFDAAIADLGSRLRARQRADGGWTWRDGSNELSDSMVTALVGLGLDTLDPSPDAPEVRRAVQFLLGTQGPDGLWASQNRVASTQLMASTWVEIWLPVLLERLRGIDTDLHIELPPDVALVNADPPPADMATTPQGLGLRWRLTGVTDAARELRFDLDFQDLKAGETRTAARGAELRFRSASGEEVRLPLSVPAVTAGVRLTPAASTDRPLYSGQDQARFVARVGSDAAEDRLAQVGFAVVDAQGQLVERLPAGPAVTIPAGAFVEVPATWPTDSVLAGRYTLRVELRSPQGLPWGEAVAGFEVQPAQDEQLPGARLAADRQRYDGAQPVRLTARAINRAGNAVLEEIQAHTSVRNAAGALVFERSEAIAQLAAGAQRAYGYELAAASLLPGDYDGRLELRAGTRVLAESRAAFSVLGAEHTGLGLGGLLQVDPARAFLGQPVRLKLTVQPAADVDLRKATLVLRLLDPSTGDTLQTFEHALAAWSPGQPVAPEWTWTAVGRAAQVVMAAATVRMEGRELPLAQARIDLLGMPRLVVEPAAGIFEPATVGQERLGQFMLRSVGTAPAALLPFTLHGPDAARFQVVGGPCTGQAVLTPGAACALTLRYASTDPGTHQASLQVPYAHPQEAGGQGVVLLPLSAQSRPLVFAARLLAQPRTVEGGDTIDLGYVLSHGADIPADGSFSLRILDAKERVLARWPFTARVPPGSGFASHQPWPTPTSAQTLRAVLAQDAPAGAPPKVLATAPFDVVAPQPPLRLTVQPRPEARVLVWASCPTTRSKNPYGAGDGRPAACARAQHIARVLDTLGVEAHIVRDEAEFRSAMRCGTYNAFWLSGELARPGPELVQALSLAVRTGKALIADGPRTSGSGDPLAPLLGAWSRGTLAASGLVAEGVPNAAFQGARLGLIGEGARLEPSSGDIVALFRDRYGRRLPNPAIVANRWGLGQGLVFAFDIASLLADGQLRDAADVLVGTAISAIAQVQEQPLAGEPTAWTLALSNPAERPVDVDATTDMPALVTHIQSDPPPFREERGGPAWTFNLTPRAGQQIAWRLKAQQPGTHEVLVRLQARPSEGRAQRPPQEAPVQLRVPDRAGLLQQLRSQLGALTPSRAERYQLAPIGSLIDRAAVQTPERALPLWADAAQRLDDIRSADTGPALRSLGRLVQLQDQATCRPDVASAPAAAPQAGGY